MSFEKGMQELNRIVKKLDSEQSSLEESVAEWEKGIKVIDYCERKLRDAEDRVNLLLSESDLPHLKNRQAQHPPSENHQPLDLEDLD
jgi:exodeoxyribonuclease VII small subunit